MGVGGGRIATKQEELNGGGAGSGNLVLTLTLFQPGFARVLLLDRAVSSCKFTLAGQLLTVKSATNMPRSSSSDVAVLSFQRELFECLLLFLWEDQ